MSNGRLDIMTAVAVAFVVLVAVFTLAGVARADELCWQQPPEPPADRWRVEVAGITVPAEVVLMPPDYPRCKGLSECYCAELPDLLAPYPVDAVAINAGGETPSSNGPLVIYRSRACRLDVNDDGAVGMGDLSAVLTEVVSGSVCE